MTTAQIMTDPWYPLFTYTSTDMKEKDPRSLVVTILENYTYVELFNIYLENGNWKLWSYFCSLQSTKEYFISPRVAWMAKSLHSCVCAHLLVKVIFHPTIYLCFCCHRRFDSTVKDICLLMNNVRNLTIRVYIKLWNLNVLELYWNEFTFPFVFVKVHVWEY